MEIKNEKATLVKAGILTSAVFLPAVSMASVDYTSMTSAFAATDIVTGLLAIGTVFATIYVAWKGIKMVLGMMKGS